MNKDGEALWQEAKTFTDMCELTAQYLNGGISFSPHYGGPPEPETADIAPFLTAFNRAGFMTAQSQPGETDKDYKQRAWVEGYALRSTAKVLGKLGLYTDLVVFTYASGYDGGHQIPITISESRPFTWAGSYFSEGLESFEEVCSIEAYTELLGACYVVVIDPVWGRNDYIWPLIATELDGFGDSRYSPDPHPDLALGTDFLGFPLTKEI